MIYVRKASDVKALFPSAVSSGIPLQRRRVDRYGTTCLIGKVNGEWRRLKKIGKVWNEDAPRNPAGSVVGMASTVDSLAGKTLICTNIFSGKPTAYEVKLDELSAGFYFEEV